MSSSPSSKRNLKPSPMSASPSQLTVTADAPTLQHLQPSDPFTAGYGPPSPPIPRKRRASGQQLAPTAMSAPSASTSAYTDPSAIGGESAELPQPAPKKGRTNTPWTAAEEQRLKVMRDAGNSWSEIAKTFPTRTEGSVKKHWYKDMHYAEFAEDESAALLAAIKEYEASKWKVIGAKVGKPAKACEQYAKEHFGGRV
ncbi:hypothetical protein K490DRAFT_71764 [Saccharata proteae CBS 121410]|uniref:MYB DNA-binding domain-containing protein n=1 Tax=Saccharata proteae CBS 121410 TaxID=1314787 RepID=A0A9P4HZ44_9PEZI|nr:hypothetical protein K490DRAFT_71764 [Saccharata proteae CBS 121410]